MNIDTLIDAVIAREGGYSNHPADRGGPTNWGVTQQVARAYGYMGDMSKMPRATAVSIYKSRYWTGPKFDQVAAIFPEIGHEIFDTGINMGPAVAAKFLQRVLNVCNRGGDDYPDITADGNIGPMTLAAARSLKAKRGGATGEIRGEPAQLAVVSAQTIGAAAFQKSVCIIGPFRLGDGDGGRPRRLGLLLFEMLQSTELRDGPRLLVTPRLALRPRRGCGLGRPGFGPNPSALLQVQRIPAKAQPAQQGDRQRHGRNDGRRPAPGPQTFPQSVRGHGKTLRSSSKWGPSRRVRQSPPQMIGVSSSWAAALKAAAIRP